MPDPAEEFRGAPEQDRIFGTLAVELQEIAVIERQHAEGVEQRGCPSTTTAVRLRRPCAKEASCSAFGVIREDVDRLWAKVAGGAGYVTRVKPIELEIWSSSRYEDGTGSKV